MLAEDTATSRRPLIVAGLVAILVAAVGTFSPHPSDPDLLFGVDRYRDLGVPAFLAACTLLAAILGVPGLAGRVARIAERAGGLPPAAVMALVVGAAGLFSWFLPNHCLSGDAASVVYAAATGGVYPSNALTNYLHNGVSRLLVDDPVVAIRLVGAVAAMVYAAAAVGIGRACFAAGARRVGLTAVLLFAGTVALLFGTIEYYSPLVAMIAVYLLAGVRWLRGTGRGLWAPLTLGVAFVLHGSAGLLLPSLLVLANRGRFRPAFLGRAVVWGLLFLVPVAIVFAGLWFVTWEGEPPPPGPQRTGTFLGAPGQGPILLLVHRPQDPTRRYAILDLEHLVGIANLVLLVAAAGVALLAVGRRRWGEPVFNFVSVAALFLVLFPVFWNICYDLKSDWDLFSPLGIPLTLLGGLAFFSARSRGADAVRAVALSLFFLVPLVLTNHLADRHRYRYSATMAAVLSDALPAVVAKEAVAEVHDRADRVRRERLEGIVAGALWRVHAFAPPGLDAVPNEPGAAIDTRLAAAIARARGRGSPEIPVHLLALRIADDLGADGRRVESDVERVFALDGVLQGFGAYTTAARRVEPDALRSAFRDTEPDGELLVDALLDVLDRPDARWRGLLAAHRRWDARKRAHRPPGHEVSYRRVDWLWTARGDMPRAEAHARYRLAGAPGDARWLDLLGGIVLARGGRTEGRALVEQAIAAEPQFLLARIRLASVLSEEGDGEGAERLLERGLRLSGLYSEVPSALFQLAWLRNKRGERGGAASAARLCLAMLDGRPDGAGNADLRRRAGALLRLAEGRTH